MILGPFLFPSAISQLGASALGFLAGSLLVGGALLVLLRRQGRAPTVARRRAWLHRVRDRAVQAERLADDLESQAHHLEEQTAELEALNDELRMLEERMRAIIDAALDAIVVADGQSVVIEWNRPAEVLFGWTASEAIGRRLTELIIPPQFREAHERGMRHYLETGEGPILNQRIEIVALCRDGTQFPVELTVVPTTWGSTPIFASFIRDIRERRLVEQRLAAEHAVTRVLAESERLDEAAPRILEALGSTLGWDYGGFWRVEPHENRIRCAATWCRTGFDAEKFDKIAWNSSFAPGEGLPGRTWERREPVWVTDVVADPNFPRAGPAQEAGLHGAFAFPIVDGDTVLAVIDFFHHEVLHPNDPLLDMIAAVGSDIGQSMRRMRAEEERDRALAAIAKANVELQATNTALAEQTGAAEEARRIADEANQAKSEFLANMSHELRTPLNAILGYVDLLDMGIGGGVTEAQRAQLERVRVSSRHLLSLIEDVLDISKVEAGRMGVEVEHGRVADVAAAALALVVPQAEERDLRLENQCVGSDVTYLGDEDRVRQILVNLLSNAVKFTEPGGRVTLRCGVTTRPDPTARISGTGPWVCLQVEDTGIGIAPEEQTTVFEPFVQAEKGRTRTRGGTGLGLTISRQLARLMAGDLTLRSEPGRGSCFTVWLPTTATSDDLLRHPEEAPSYAGFASIGESLQARVLEIAERFCRRLRTDPVTVMAHAMSDAEVEDHQISYLTDLGQSLVLLESAAAPDLLRDGSDVQRLLAMRHGAQRARYHWTEEALRREYQILSEEVHRAVRQAQPDSPALDPALDVLRRLMDQAEQTSLRGLRTVAVTSSER